MADDVELEVLFEEDDSFRTSKFLGAAGATEAMVAGREAELGVRLPDDYRSFLLASNGFRGLAGLPHGICRLLPVEDIGWMRTKDTSGRLKEYLKDRRRGVALPDEFLVDPEEYARTILIGESDGNEFIALLPPHGDSQWALWTYHPETGFETDLTFTELMESSLEV